MSASWRSSWGLAIRMARRDLRRHLGRSMVILVMVGIPTALLSFALTSYATSALNEAEAYAVTGGSADAIILAPMFADDSSDVPLRITQDGHSQQMSFGSEGAKGVPIPGYSRSATPQQNAAAIARLVGGTAVPVRSGQERVDLGERRLSLATLVTDARTGLGAKAELLTGRWPDKPGEVVVTPQAIQRGLPASGTLAVRSGEGTTAVTIVGTARAWGDYAMADWVALDHISPDQPENTVSWLILGSGDITWDRVGTLSSHGLRVVSRYLIAHPPTSDQLPAEMRDQADFYVNEGTSMAVAGGAILVLVTGLLVAPAFAVSAARQRRTLALSASNGATTAHLRRMVLSQALVLGVLAAIIGSAVGVAAASLVGRLFESRGGRIAYAPLDIPWLAVLGVTACAVVAAVGAALIPARRLGRLDIVGVMKGQNVSPAPSRLLPLVGVILMVGGSALLVTGMKVLHLSQYLVPLGVLGLVLGAICLVPLLLVTVGRLAHGTPFPVRLAARDAARQRARSGPAVAAIVGGVAAIVTLLIAITSDTVEQRRSYQPMLAIGEGSFPMNPASVKDNERILDAIGAKFPSLVLTPQILVTGTIYEGTPDPDYVPTFVGVQLPGCTPAQTIYDREYWVAVAPTLSAGVTYSPPDPPCQALGDTATIQTGPSAIVALPAAEIVRRVGLTGAQAEQIGRGGAVILGHPEAVAKGTLTLVAGRMNASTTPTPEGSFPVDDDATVTETVTVPALSVAATPERTGIFVNGARVLVAREAISATSLPTSEQGVIVRDRNGPISQQTQEAVGQLLGDDYGMSVERGFQRDDQLALSILMVAFALIMLVVTLTSTALSLAEQQREDATLAAVGATRGTRRLMAAGQALVTSGVGTVLGIVVGSVCGYALTFPLTALSWDPVTGGEKFVEPTVAVPWAWLAVAVLGVPLLATALAAIGVRRAPVVTRRLA